MSRPDGRAVRCAPPLRGPDRARHRRAAAVAAFARTAAAQPPTLVAALGSRPAPKTIVAQITLNEQKKGQFFVTVIDGRFLARTEDLKAIGLTSARGQTRTSGGEEYVWVDSIAGSAGDVRRGAAFARPRRRPQAPAGNDGGPVVGARRTRLLPGQRERVLQLRRRLFGGKHRCSRRILDHDAGRSARRRPAVPQRLDVQRHIERPRMRAAHDEPDPRPPRNAGADDRRRLRIRVRLPRDDVQHGRPELLEALRHRPLLHPLPAAEPDRPAANAVGGRRVHRRPARPHAAAAGRRLRPAQRHAGHRLSQRGPRDPRRVRPRAARQHVVLLERALAQGGAARVQLQRGRVAREFRRREQRLRPSGVRRLSSLRGNRRVDARRPRRRKERPLQRRSDGDHRARGGGAAQRRGIGQRGWRPHGRRRAGQLQLSRPALQRGPAGAQGQPAITRRSSTSGSSGATTNSRATSATRPPMGIVLGGPVRIQDPTKDRTAGRRA